MKCVTPLPQLTEQYGFFLEPVDTEHYPDYLDIIGGADKMMDLGTMQQKVDDGSYRDMDELEVGSTQDRPC